MSWNEPSRKTIEKALEDWAWGGWKMVNIEVEWIDGDTITPDPEDDESPHPDHETHGDHYLASLDFERDGEWVGRARFRYRADGVAYLDHVYLTEAAVRSGGMTHLLADFLPYYREWGIERVQNPTPVEAGVKFAQSQGFKPKDGDEALHELVVPPA